MTIVRRSLREHRWLAAWLLAMTLAVRLLVPAGYMPGSAAGGGGLSLRLCSGHAAALPAAMAMPGGTHHRGDGKSDGKADQPCAFTGLVAPSLASADPAQPLPGVAVAIVAAPMRAAESVRVPTLRLRPPLRGPPALG